MSQIVPFLTEEPLPPSPNDRSWVRRGVALLGLVVFVVGLVWAVHTVRSLLPEESAASRIGVPVTVLVESGSSLTAVGASLVDAGVVPSVSAFLAAVEIDERAVSIGPGVYNLETGLPATEAVNRMLDPQFREPPLVLREGLRLEETVRLTSERTGISQEDLEAVLLQPASLNIPSWARNRPEGVLFPASYDVLPNQSAEDVLSAMVERFRVTAQETDLERRAARIGYTPYEVLIVASLVQAEAAPDDFRKVARVAYNRLEQGLPLQFDSTVNYALGTSTLLVTESMLQTDSPYNTYINKGLPPTPINSPGEAAIEAALRPANGDWLYFVTVDPATLTTRFTADYATFLLYKQEFRDNYANRTTTPAVP
jgi:UPF0755 protein